MPFHAVCYETLSSRSNGASANRPNLTTTRFLEPGWSTPGFVSNPFSYPLIPPSAHGITSLVQHMAFNPSAAASHGLAYANSDFQVLDGVTVDNGATPAFAEEIITGRQSPRTLFRPDGGLRAAILALPNQAQLDVWVTETNNMQDYFGLTHFIGLEEWPPDSEADGSVALAALLDKFVNSGSVFPLGTSGGQPIQANNCGYAGIDPAGIVYIRPEDWQGTEPDQIPSTAADNQPSNFLAHPTVFYPAGKARYVRAITRQHVDNTPIATSPAFTQPFAIQIVQVAPTFSRWLVGVDGAFQVIRLPHPAATDYRRPRDIWNNVWQPILQGPSSSANALNAANPEGFGGTNSFRWQYADYFRCLPFTGAFEDQTIAPG